MYAFFGLGYVVRTQKNAILHLFATLIVISLSIYLRLSTIEYAILGIVIGLVWMAECFNTSIESIVDLVSPEYHNLARVAKDAGAAAVLVSAITAIFIGILILGPPIVLIILSLAGK